MAVERTFIFVKPDGMRRMLVPEIMKRFYNRDYFLVGAKLVRPSREHFLKHYEEHKGKPFLDGLIKYVMGAPVLAMVWKGENVIKEARDMIGATNPASALPGTIRKDFCQTMSENAIHGSDSAESAEREIKLWFSDSELHNDV